MTLLLPILAGFAAAFATERLLKVAFRSERTKRYVISEDPHRSITGAILRRRVRLSTLVSLALLVGCTFAFESVLFHDRPLSLWRSGLEAVTVLVIYDFLYYFLHRFPFHEWKMLRDVHAVHHAARNPRATDAQLLHPLETALGLLSFLASIAIVGGVHLATFGVLFSAYTSLNVLNHAGIDIPHFPFKTLGILAAKHDRHHHSMLSGNYASITPLPDFIFGTLE